MTQVHVSGRGFGFNYKLAAAERKCIRGCVINAGSKYLRVYVIKDAKITKEYNFCGAHFGKCEQCGAPVFARANGFYLRFDSDGCAQRHFDAMMVGAEEAMWA